MPTGVNADGIPMGFLCIRAFSEENATEWNALHKSGAFKASHRAIMAFEYTNRHQPILLDQCCNQRGDQFNVSELGFLAEVN